MAYLNVIKVGFDLRVSLLRFISCVLIEGGADIVSRKETEGRTDHEAL